MWCLFIHVLKFKESSKLNWSYTKLYANLEYTYSHQTCLIMLLCVILATPYMRALCHNFTRNKRVPAVKDANQSSLIWIVVVYFQYSHHNDLFYSMDGGQTKFLDLIQLVEFYQLNAAGLPCQLTDFISTRRRWRQQHPTVTSQLQRISFDQSKLLTLKSSLTFKLFIFFVFVFIFNYFYASARHHTQVMFGG